MLSFESGRAHRLAPCIVGCSGLIRQSAEAVYNPNLPVKSYAASLLGTKTRRALATGHLLCQRRLGTAAMLFKEGSQLALTTADKFFHIADPEILQQRKSM